MVWTRAMDKIVLHDGFVPQNCNTPPQPAVSVGAGVIWLHLYDGGDQGRTLCAGRRVHNGGCRRAYPERRIWQLSRYYGTAAASLLVAKVVTADGAVRIVNAYTNPDLFWALKGGGEGSFGVVTGLTLKICELAERAGAAIFTVKAMSGLAFRELIRKFVGFYAERLMSPHWGGSVNFQRNGTLSVAMLSYGLDRTQGRRLGSRFSMGSSRRPKTTG